MAIIITVNLYLLVTLNYSEYNFHPPNVTQNNVFNEKYIKNNISSIKHITLKVLLVEFSDVKHRSPNYPSKLSLPAYTINDFENLLFSENKYFSPNMFSPDNKKVYGSLRDYYRIMSNGKLIIDGFILNLDADNNNVPDWITLNNSKKYYDSNRVDQFRKDSRSIAKSKGLDISTDGQNFLAIVYAGHTYRDYNIKTLIPHAFTNEHEYIVGERFASGFPYREERDDSNLGSVSHFSHMGIHAHEFGHLLGFDDHLGGYDNGFWCLMSKGCLNGPQREGACPAPLNPYLRSMNNWIEIDSVSGIVREKIYYSANAPKIFKLQDNCSNSFFLVEFRIFNTDLSPNNKILTNYNSFIHKVSLDNGILIWRKLKGNFVKLIYPCGCNCSNGDQHILPGLTGSRVLTPWSDNRTCKAGYYWVPNTKPSNNCGLEIISTERDHYTVDLYQTTPYLSSPSSPYNFKSISGENVILTWDKNLEPDLFYYKIYKSDNNVDYKLYATTQLNIFKDTLEFIDSLSNSDDSVYYKISSVDSSRKESNLSPLIKLSVKNKLSAKSQNELIEESRTNLAQNYPNPFNPNTTIKYSIQRLSKVKLKIFDGLGRELRTLIDDIQKQGKYEVKFDGSQLPSGLYFYRIHSDDYVETKKMILLK